MLITQNNLHKSIKRLLTFSKFDKQLSTNDKNNYKSVHFCSYLLLLLNKLLLLEEFLTQSIFKV